MSGYRRLVLDYLRFARVECRLIWRRLLLGTFHIMYDFLAGMVCLVGAIILGVVSTNWFLDIVAIAYVVLGILFLRRANRQRLNRKAEESL